VIETMVELGMTLPSVHAVLDLDEALALSRKSSRTGGSTAGDSEETLDYIPDESAQIRDEAVDWDALGADSPFAGLSEV